MYCCQKTSGDVFTAFAVPGGGSLDLVPGFRGNLALGFDVDTRQKLLGDLYAVILRQRQRR